jgi:sugar O-acyltransferase (sialic acid O-acetyltransferase NeuD family)
LIGWLYPKFGVELRLVADHKTTLLKIMATHNRTRKNVISSGKKICIVGIGGFGREVLCCLMDALDLSINEIATHACFMVSDHFYKEQKVLGVEVIRESQFDPTLFDVVIGVGDPLARQKMVSQLPKETTYATIIHPSVVMSPWVEIGEGSVITAGCILTCNIKIGAHAHLNLHTTIGHDCVIADFFTSAPGANISGNCNFGECVYFGTNASVRQGINICENVTIGMGGVVVKDIVESGVYVGLPLRKLIK